MALTKTTEVDKLEVVGTHKMVHVRTATIVSEDGVELSRSFHRHVLAPQAKNGALWENTDISGETQEVQDVCDAVWTANVKLAYREYMDAQES